MWLCVLVYHDLDHRSLLPHFHSGIQNILETINNIPIHIGVKDLKDICFLTLLPIFIMWSKGAELTVNETKLCMKDWVELRPLPGGLDVDAIAAKFFVAQGKSKTVQFYAGKGIELYLELLHEKHLDILQHLEEMEDNKVRILDIHCSFPQDIPASARVQAFDDSTGHE